jgi:hypothetical protein
MVHASGKQLMNSKHLSGLTVTGFAVQVFDHGVLILIG